MSERGDVLGATVRSHQARYDLFSKTYCLPVSKLALSHAGFTPTGEKGEVGCAWCNLHLKNFRPDHQPLAWHRAFSGHFCPFLLDNRQHNIADLGDEQYLESHKVFLTREVGMDFPSKEEAIMLYKHFCAVR